MTTAPAEKEAGAPPLLPAKEAGAPPLPTAQQPGGRRRARLILGLVLAVALAAAAAQLWVGGRTLTRLVLARGVSRPAALTSNTNAARQAAWGALGSSCDAVAARPAASRCNHEQFADVCERRAKGLRTFCEGHSSGACIAAPRGDGVLCDLRHVHIARLGATRNWVGEGASVRRQTSYQCDSKFWPPAGMFLPKNRAQVSSWGFDHWLIKGAVVNASKPLARASGGEVDGACVPGVSVFVQRYTGLNFWHTMESVFALIESLFLLGIRPSEARAVFFDGWALTRPASRGLEAVWASVLTAAPPMHFWGENRGPCAGPNPWVVAASRVLAELISLSPQTLNAGAMGFREKPKRGAKREDIRVVLIVRGAAQATSNDSKTVGRQLENSKEVLALLQRVSAEVALKSGVRVSASAVDFGAASLKRQLEDDGRTDILVGNHGAGLTHCTWLRKSIFFGGDSPRSRLSVAEAATAAR
ncbi:hypothetical protein T492DRAFT_1001788 [Pavlovales sp. CCMP2436]|nr:hypothetical protein T492DRAFT_1001788 [Pavlovales sp. CCMP2436]